jgi:hypothetical protein
MGLSRGLDDFITDLAEQIIEWVISHPIICLIILVLLIAWAVRGYKTL